MKPKEHHWNAANHPRMPQPKTDDGYFEHMIRVAFASGLNWKMIANKWEHFKKAFAGFSVDKVSKFGARDADRLMKDAGIIRNRPKIEGTIANAKEMVAVKKEFGSFRRYLEHLRMEGGESLMRKELRNRLSYLGKGTVIIFLLGAGESMPESIVASSLILFQ